MSPFKTSHARNGGKEPAEATAFEPDRLRDEMLRIHYRWVGSCVAVLAGPLLLFAVNKTLASVGLLLVGIAMALAILLRRRHPMTSVWLYLAFMTLAIVFVVYHTGGIRSPNAVFLLALIGAAGLFLPRLQAILFGAMIAGLLLTMALRPDLVPPPGNSMPAVSIFLTYVLAGLVMIAPLGLVLRSMRAANGQLRVELQHRREAEEELRLYERIVNQMREDVVYTDRRGQILYVNASFERVTGYSREECLGNRCSVLRSGVHSREFYEELWSVISKGGVWSGVFINRTKSGKLIHQDTMITPITNAEGQIVGYLGIKRDITERLELERKYVQAQRLEAIGALAGGVAHDFNNILCSIIGFTELAKMDAGHAPALTENLDHVLQSSSRARELIQRILTFGRKTTNERRPVRVGDVLLEVVKLLRPALTSSVSVQMEVEPDLPPILIDPTQLHQVLMNLGTNAGHALRGVSAPRLSLRCRRVDPPAALLSGAPELKAGRILLIEVEDNGHGMTTEVLQRIYEPFFSTKPQGEGNGLGLAVVHGIVKEAGGTIDVQSQPGQGTSFRLYFPMTDRPEGPETVEQEFRFKGNQERVLFVDDEPFLCSYMEQLLERYGLRVTACYEPREALRIAAEQPPFDLVISDYAMPGMTGLELAGNLRRMHPRLPVILASGLLSPEVRARLEQQEIRTILPKPYTPASITAALSQVLPGPAASNRSETGP